MTHNQRTILLIENDEPLSTALATRLGHEGYRVLVAHSGAQGVTTFQEHHIELIITDLNMPAGDGAEVARSIRRQSDVPIIVITGFRSAYARKLRAIPNVSILEKPFQWQSLAELIEAHMVLGARTF